MATGGNTETSGNFSLKKKRLVGWMPGIDPRGMRQLLLKTSATWGEGSFWLRAVSPKRRHRAANPHGAETKYFDNITKIAVKTIPQERTHLQNYVSYS
jgi:hypothetical protein